MKISSFQDLAVWQEAHKLALMVYRVTNEFPNEEKFGLVT
jgi:four helix bundle protein